MRQVKEEAACNDDTAIDFDLAVEELHRFNSQELSKLLKDSENYTIQLQTAKGLIEVDMEKFAWFLPLHLIAVLVSSGGECRLRYLLKGVRLLHSLCDLASRNNRLEQILLEEVKVSEQMLDLVFYILIVLAGYEKESRVGSTLPLLHSALVACSLHLLTGFISSQWQDLVHVLLVHPKVDTFMDVSFDAVRIDIRFFQIKLLALNSEVVCNKSSLPAAERTANSLCQQCEASLQLLQFLCQQKMFRERLLKNKELCRNGGILSLAQAILKFKIPSHFEEFSNIVAAICRMKSKILSILLQLCETESISYLDEVASSPRSMNVAKDFVFEILGILKATFGKEPKQLGYGLFINKPTGFVLLNSMRLADIFSDDSNFRSLIVTNITPILADVLSQPHEDFVCGWCSTKLQLTEEDVTLEFDPFIAAEMALMPDTENESNATCPFIFNNIQPAPHPHAQQRTAFLVKIIANLHCFVPNICEEQEKDQFINKVFECLCMDPSKSSSINSSELEGHKASTVCDNLGSLLDHAISLVPSCLNEEDLQLLSVFSAKLQGLIPRMHDGNTASKEPDLKDVEMQDQDLCLSSQNQLGRGNFRDASNVNSLLMTSGSSLYAAPNCSYDQLLTKEKVPCGKEAAVRPTRMLDPTDSDGASTFNGKMVTSGCSVGFMKQCNNADQMFDPGEFPQLKEHLKEGCDAVIENEKIEVSQGEEKQMKKRKRNIMNEKQIKLIENALVDEPEMQRNSAMVQLWADKLSSHGSEITSSQLKNWLNNRKAKLARAAREVRPPSEGENAIHEKACGSSTVPSCDSPESPVDDFYAPVAMTRTSNNTAKYEFVGADYNDFASQPNMQNLSTFGYVRCEPGQYVALVDGEGKEICRGQVCQVEGRWHGKCLEEAGICVVDVIDLKVDRWTRVPHPLESAGTTFDEAEAMHGVMRVAWDANKIFLLHP